MQTDQIKMYAPHGAKSLTKEQLAAMADFTKEDLRDLAAAYPNSPNLNAYLVLKDTSKPDNKQVYPLSTWKNLYELHKMGNNKFIALSFKSIFTRKPAGKLNVAPLQDLTKEQVKSELGDNKEKTAKQLAEEESFNFDEKPAGPLEFDKPLSRMNKQELTGIYITLFGEEPKASLKNAELVKAINKKNV